MENETLAVLKQVLDEIDMLKRHQLTTADKLGKRLDRIEKKLATKTVPADRWDIGRAKG